MSGLNYIVGLGNQQLWDFGRAVYGSSRAGEFLRDLASGANGLDIVVVGDSNTGSAAADMWGYHHGFQQALWERGYTCYATPVCPLVTGFTTGTATATPSIWRGANTMVTGGLAGNAPLLDGDVSGGSTPYAAWDPGTTWTRYGSSTSSPPYKESWAYLANTTQYFSSDGVSIDIDHPLNTNGTTLYYRVRYGRIVGSTGAICPIVLNAPANTDASTRQAFSATSPTGGIDSLAAEVSWTANGTNAYRGGWAYVAPGFVTNGPVAVHSHSMYRRTKGWGVTSHGYQGGETSTQIGEKIDTVKGDPLKEHLKELRARQIAAGGTGRVLVLAHAGVNGSETGTVWVTAMRRLWNAYKSAWSGLGYPAADLAIIAWVSHMYSANDTSAGVSPPAGNMAQMRASSKTMAITEPDMTVVDVSQMLSYNQLVNGSLVSGVSRSYYQKDASNVEITKAHLSGGLTGASTWSPNDGYTELSHLIIGTLIAQN
jgi:hypothetical protein